MSFPGLLSNASLLRATLPQRVIVDVRSPASHIGDSVARFVKSEQVFTPSLKFYYRKLKKKKKKEVFCSDLWTSQ